MKQIVLEYPNGRMVLNMERFFPCTAAIGKKIFPMIKRYASEEDKKELEKYLVTCIRNGQTVSESLFADAEKYGENPTHAKLLKAEAKSMVTEWKRAQRNLFMLGGT